MQTPGIGGTIGGMSAVDNVKAALLAIDRNSDLNAFVAVHRENSLKRARELDESGEAPGPLFGMAVAVKDNIDEAGEICTAGSAAYRDRVPDRDAGAITRLKQAGAVLVGRTNMHELADGVTSENPHYGPVHNPLRRGFHPGGSSGGSAAAVAAGCVPAALGTDTGVSILIPASLCGAVGFKPTAGRVPTDGVVPLSTTLDHVGPITRSCRECARLLSVLAGDTTGELAGSCDRAPGGLRIGVLSGFGIEPDPQVGIAFEQALGTLERMGHTLVPLHLPVLAQGLQILSRIYAPEAARYHRERLRARPGDFGEDVRADLERGLKVTQEDYQQALRERETLSAELERAMRDLDLLASPATPHPARPIGSANPYTYLIFTCPFNLSGQPALSVPMGTIDGLPIGLQLIGSSGADATVLSAAGAFEQV
jgi:aspartyl-tRNA(Asn)/glutamyl-tRNA(Gln) amidotransferase subunit A